MATPIFPVMDNMYIETFFFFVPNRLLWDNWQKFMGEQDDPGDSIDFTIPIINSGVGYGNETLEDYLGYPTLVPGLEHSVLWNRAYNLIYQQWFRDQNLQNSPPINRGDGPDDLADYKLLRRGKRHDYFTSSLPFQQKGDPVTIPLGQQAPIISDGTAIKVAPSTDTGVDSNISIDSSDEHLVWAGANQGGPVDMLGRLA